MLPRMAMPSAPPSSAPVSEIPEAAPARSGGAEPTIRSVVAVNTGASPSDTTSEAPARIARSASADPLPTWVRAPRPTAAMPRPAPITQAGRRWRVIRGARLEPTMNPPADGEHGEEQRQRGRRQGRPGDAQQQPAAADAVAQGAHGDQEPGDHEPVDVGDPQQLGAAWPQV